MTPRRPKAQAARPVRLDELFAMASALSSTLDVDVLLKKIGQAAEQLTDAEASSILLMEDGGKHLFFKVATGEKGNVVRKHTIAIGQGIAGWVAEHWKPVVSNDVSSDGRFSSAMDDATGFRTRSVLAVPLLMAGDVIGVLEAINKRAPEGFSESDRVSLEHLASLAAVSITNARLNESQQNFFTNMIEILTAAIESHDPHYMGHPSRVAESACAIGRRLGVEGRAYRDLYYGALLHDIGFLAVRHQLLVEQAVFYGRERGADRLHPVLGADILKGVKLFSGIVPIVRHHHEYWDGTGFPDRLAGDRIPVAARILCLLEALEEIRFAGVAEPDLATLQLQMARNGSGSKFDPAVVEAYLAIVATGASPR